MSSSSSLKNRLNNHQDYNIGVTYDNSYLRPYNDCHPGDIARPIGRPDGPKICIRNPNSLPQAQNKESAHEHFLINKKNNRYNLYGGGVVRNRLNNTCDVIDYLRHDKQNIDYTSGNCDEMIPNQKYLMYNKFIPNEIPYNGLGFPNNLKARYYKY